MRSLLVAACIGLLLQVGGAQDPDQYFGFHIGADGELARYPKIFQGITTEITGEGGSAAR